MSTDFALVAERKETRNVRYVGRCVGVGGAHRGIRVVALVSLVVGLVVMHGLGFSHAQPPEFIGTAQVSAHGAPASSSSEGSTPLVGSPMTSQPDRHGPGPGHGGLLARSCLAILGALLVAVAVARLVTRSWPAGKSGLPVVRVHPLLTTRFRARPRPYLLCVMRI